MDLLHKVTSWAEHNRWLVLGLILTVAISALVIGCQPRTVSLVNPDQKVDAVQLTREVAIIQQGVDDQAAVIRQLQLRYEADVASKQAEIKAAGDDLEAQQLKRLELLRLATGFATVVTEGGLTPLSAVGFVGQLGAFLLAGGAGIDSLRKSKVIGTLKNGASAQPPAA